MGETLQKRIYTFIQQVFDAGDRAWLVWCDPHGDWLPLLRRVASDRRMGSFTLVEVDEKTAGIIGGPVTRPALQRRLDAHEEFVLYVPAAHADLGWLWGQALLAERIYDRSLRSQLMEWGWRPHSLTVSDDEVAALARANLQQDPAEWSAGGLQPDPDQLLDVLAGLAAPNDENRLVLALTVEQAGLPPLDEDDLPGWRRRGLAHLLATHAHRAAPDRIAATHVLVVPMPQRTFALQLLDRWVDSHRLAQTLPDAIEEADALAGLAMSLAGADAADGPFISYAAEAAAFANTCRRLAQMDGRALIEALADVADVAERHHQGLWGRRMAGDAKMIPWGELGRLSGAARELVEATPASSWASPQAAVAWYVGGGWRMDRAGEEIERSLESTSPDLTELITPLRRACRARWENTLIRWSEVWGQAGCPQPDGLPTAGSWLKAALEASPVPTAVLTLDALRYALGATLAQRLNHQEGVARAKVYAARAPLPSITAIGMAAALPVEEQQLKAERVGDEWRTSFAGSGDNLSVADKRRAWWSSQPKTTVLDGLAPILAGDVLEPSHDRRRLVVYDAIIDRAGHDSLDYQGSWPALNRYLAAIEHLRDRGWRRILVVTDHGFIQWAGATEHHVDFPAPDPAYTSRRAVAYPAAVRLEGPQALAPGGAWKIAFPSGAACFRTYGGLGYFHGGASLQEWIIPCIAVEWPQTAQPVTVSIEPLPRILSVRPKVMLNVSAGSILREDSIPRQVEVMVRDAATQAILFRSQSIMATVDTPQLEVSLAAREGVTAARGAPLIIQVRDPRTELPLSSTDSLLMIEMTGW